MYVSFSNDQPVSFDYYIHKIIKKIWLKVESLMFDLVKSY